MRIHTIAELEADLKQLEIENDMMTSAERARNGKYYLRQKQYLTDSIIDIQIGPSKRKVRAAIAPYFDRINRSERVGFEPKLQACRSIAEVQNLYKHWRDKLAHKLIADLPEFENLDQRRPKANQISNAA